MYLFSVIGTTYGAGDGETTFNVPDFRECLLVGAGTNSTDTIATHDEYTLGQFKDDQLQNMTGAVYGQGNRTGFLEVAGVLAPIGTKNVSTGAAENPTTTTSGYVGASFNAARVARTGTTTHGKQKGVNFIIKF